jgi:hypothetical protein
VGSNTKWGKAVTGNQDAITFFNLRKAVDTHLIIWPAARFCQLSLLVVPLALFCLVAILGAAGLMDFCRFLILVMQKYFFEGRVSPYSAFENSAFLYFYNSEDQTRIIQSILDINTILLVIISMPVNVYIVANLLRFSTQLLGVFLFVLYFSYLLHHEYSDLSQALSNFIFRHKPLSAGNFIDESLAILLINVWSNVILFYFFIIILRAFYLAWMISPSDRKLYANIGENSSASHQELLLAVFGLSANLRNSSRKVRTALFLYVSMFFSQIPLTIAYFIPGMILLLGFTIIVPIMNSEVNSGFSKITRSSLILTFGCLSYYLVIKAMFFIGKRGIVAAQNYLRVSLQRAISTDQRRPLLFLRSFKNDRQVLPQPKASIAYGLLTYAERQKSIDEILLEEGSNFGPVIALGSPGEQVAPYGAAREYYDSTNPAIWREAVSKLATESQAIIVYVDDSEGLWWEVSHIVEKGYLAKSLFLLNPTCSNVHLGGKTIDHLRDLLGLTRAEIPVAENSSLIGLWISEECKTIAAFASEASRAQYLMALRIFLRFKSRSGNFFSISSAGTRHRRSPRTPQAGDPAA